MQEQHQQKHEHAMYDDIDLNVPHHPHSKKSAENPHRLTEANLSLHTEAMYESLGGPQKDGFILNYVLSLPEPSEIESPSQPVSSHTMNNLPSAESPINVSRTPKSAKATRHHANTPASRHIQSLKLDRSQLVDEIARTPMHDDTNLPPAKKRRLLDEAPQLHLDTSSSKHHQSRSLGAKLAKSNASKDDDNDLNHDEDDSESDLSGSVYILKRARKVKSKRASKNHPPHKQHRHKENTTRFPSDRDSATVTTAPLDHTKTKKHTAAEPSPSAKKISSSTTTKLKAVAAPLEPIEENESRTIKRNQTNTKDLKTPGPTTKKQQSTRLSGIKDISDDVFNSMFGVADKTPTERVSSKGTNSSRGKAKKRIAESMKSKGQTSSGVESREISAKKRKRWQTAEKKESTTPSRSRSLKTKANLSKKTVSKDTEDEVSDKDETGSFILPGTLKFTDRNPTKPTSSPLASASRAPAAPPSDAKPEKKPEESAKPTPSVSSQQDSSYMDPKDVLREAAKNAQLPPPKKPAVLKSKPGTLDEFVSRLPIKSSTTTKTSARVSRTLAKRDESNKENEDPRSGKGAGSPMAVRGGGVGKGEGKKTVKASALPLAVKKQLISNCLKEGRLSLGSNPRPGIFNKGKKGTIDSPLSFNEDEFLYPSSSAPDGAAAPTETTKTRNKIQAKLTGNSENPLRPPTADKTKKKQVEDVSEFFQKDEEASTKKRLSSSSFLEKVQAYQSSNRSRVGSSLAKVNDIDENSDNHKPSKEMDISEFDDGAGTIKPVRPSKKSTSSKAPKKKPSESKKDNMDAVLKTRGSTRPWQMPVEGLQQEEESEDEIPLKSKRDRIREKNERRELEEEFEDPRELMGAMESIRRNLKRKTEESLAAGWYEDQKHEEDREKVEETSGYFARERDVGSRVQEYHTHHHTQIEESYGLSGTADTSTSLDELLESIDHVTGVKHPEVEQRGRSRVPKLEKSKAFLFGSQDSQTLSSNSGPFPPRQNNTSSFFATQKRTSYLFEDQRAASYSTASDADVYSSDYGIERSMYTALRQERRNESYKPSSPRWDREEQNPHRHHHGHHRHRHEQRFQNDQAGVLQSDESMSFDNEKMDGGRQVERYGRFDGDYHLTPEDFPVNYSSETAVGYERERPQRDRYEGSIDSWRAVSGEYRGDGHHKDRHAHRSGPVEEETDFERLVDAMLEDM
ncbi:hypothetical protein HDV05_003096 [Chytridiales sp. JEL 0842]|nr:hypothetical protein HDV05_003096 [Chytridiales sp. JEL 0842]